MKVVFGIALVMAMVLAGCSSGGPTPEELARADQIRAGTEATATAAALVIQMRVADATAVAPATAAVLAARVSSQISLAQATAAVSSARAGSDVETAQAKPTKDWVSFFVMMALVGVLGIGLYWFAMRVRRASMRYGKTATGVVGVDETGRLFNSSTMIESTITPPTEQGDWLFKLKRIRHYLLTGDALALPEAQRPLLTDGDATAAQRTQVAMAARMGDAVAEAMSSKISERERLERMQLTRGRQPRGLMADMGAPALAAPVEDRPGQTNVTVIKPAEDNPYLQLIAGAYGVPAKALAERAQQADPMIIDQAWVASEGKK